MCIVCEPPAARRAWRAAARRCGSGRACCMRPSTRAHPRKCRCRPQSVVAEACSVGRGAMRPCIEWHGRACQSSSVVNVSDLRHGICVLRLTTVDITRPVVSIPSERGTCPAAAAPCRYVTSTPEVMRPTAWEVPTFDAHHVDEHERRARLGQRAARRFESATEHARLHGGAVRDGLIWVDRGAQRLPAEEFGEAVAYLRDPRRTADENNVVDVLLAQPRVAEHALHLPSPDRLSRAHARNVRTVFAAQVGVVSTRRRPSPYRDTS